MTVAPSELRRPMVLGEILGGSLSLYRRHFRTFLAISLVTLPFSALGTLGFWHGRRNPALVEAIVLLGLLLDIVVVAAIAQVVATAAEGLSPSFGQSYKHVLSRLANLMIAVARVFGIAFLAFVPVFLAAFALAMAFFAPSGDHQVSTRTGEGLLFGALGVGAIPAAYFLVRWAFFVQAVVLENTSSGEALSYSRDIVRGRWWRVFGILALVWFIRVVVASPATAITWTVSRSVGGTLGLVIGTMTLPFMGIAYTLLFFDLQSRESERVSIA